MPIPVPSTRGWRGRVAPVVAAVCLWGLPGSASAQGGELPTLSGLGLEYLSRSGAVQISLSGQLDLEGMIVGRDEWAGLVGHKAGPPPPPSPTVDVIPPREDWITACGTCHQDLEFTGSGGTIVSPRLRLFADFFLGDHVYALVEGRGDRGHAPSNGKLAARIEQAYLRIVEGSGSTGAQVGRFASPFGAYPLRHLTVVDPFLRPPLAYDYRTVMSRTHVAPNVSELQLWKDFPELFRTPGAPPVWDVPYQWGAMVFGSLGPFDLRVAGMNSAPSSDPLAWRFELDRFEHPSWVAGARLQATPSLELGASYNRGPWMEATTVGSITTSGGEARGWRDFDQELWSADFTLARGPMMLRGEAILDRWAVPNVPSRATDRLYNLELQWDVRAGVSLATRFGYIDFRPLAGPGGTREDWDHDVYRVEASVGYRLLRNAGVMLSAYTQGAGSGGDTVLGGGRLWYAF